MIVHVRVNTRAASVVSGSPARVDDGPVLRDLATGWTLVDSDDPGRAPNKLTLIGDRFTYTAVLGGYRLPEGLCVCAKQPCVCRSPAADRHPGRFDIIAAKQRSSQDRTTQQVLENERYYDELRSGATLEPQALATMTERWTRAHADAQKPAGGTDFARWELIVRLTDFLVAEDQGTIVLGEPPLDAEELDAGQLVLLARNEREASMANVEVRYKLPRLELAFRIRISTVAGSSSTATRRIRRSSSSICSNCRRAIDASSSTRARPMRRARASAARWTTRATTPALQRSSRVLHSRAGVHRGLRTSSSTGSWTPGSARRPKQRSPPMTCSSSRVRPARAR